MFEASNKAVKLMLFLVRLFLTLHITISFSNRICKQSFFCLTMTIIIRGGSRTAATSKMECFVIIVNGWKPLTIITKHSILDVAAVLDPPLIMVSIITIYTKCSGDYDYDYYCY